MRLTVGQQETICRVIRDHFGPSVRITLFGSRADDSASAATAPLVVRKARETGIQLMTGGEHG